MKCNNCNYESQNDFAFCPECGAAQNYVPQQDQTANLNVSSIDTHTCQTDATSETMAGFILTTLKDSLFLVICILYSVSTAFTLFSSSLPVIQILTTIFLWLTYAKAQQDIASRENLRCVSGTIFASYVVNYVIAGLCAFFGLIVMIFGGMSGDFMSTIIDYALSEAGLSAGMFGGLLSGLMVILGIFLILIAAVIVVINILCVRKIHLFVKSVYQSIGAEKTYIANANTVRVWLMVLGILGALSAVSSLIGGSFVSFIASGSGAAAEITGSILINNYYNVNKT